MVVKLDRNIFYLKKQKRLFGTGKNEIFGTVANKSKRHKIPKFFFLRRNLTNVSIHLKVEGGD